MALLRLRASGRTGRACVHRPGRSRALGWFLRQPDRLCLPTSRVRPRRSRGYRGSRADRSPDSSLVALGPRRGCFRRVNADVDRARHVQCQGPPGRHGIHARHARLRRSLPSRLLLIHVAARSGIWRRCLGDGPRRWHATGIGASHRAHRPRARGTGPAHSRGPSSVAGWAAASGLSCARRAHRARGGLRASRGDLPAGLHQPADSGQGVDPHLGSVPRE